MSGDASFGAALKSGCTLLRLAKALAPPGMVVRKPYIKGASKFKEMENVTAFIRFCRDMGVPESDNFTTVALYEQTNLAQVCTCVHSLGRVMQTKFSHFEGPTLGAKLATPNPRNITLEQRLASKGATSKWTVGNSSTQSRVTGTARSNITRELRPGASPSKPYKPGFSRHDRKRSNEMNTFPCSNYKLGRKCR